MDTKEILNFCLKRGILIDNGALDLFKDTDDLEAVKSIIGKIRDHTKKKIITKAIFYDNKEKVNEFLSEFLKENEDVNKIEIKLYINPIKIIK